jgi:hypothetical protein
MMTSEPPVPRTADHILRWFLTRVEEPEKEEGHYRAFCPNHSGQRKALVVGAFEDDGLGVKCEAGCATDAILSALGMTEEDLSLYPRGNGYADGLDTFTLAELMREKFPPVKWIVEDLIPEGTMILAGKPKMGKSWLALGLCISVASGSAALGKFEAVRGDALYLALEDNKRRLQDRGAKVLGNQEQPTHNLHLAIEAQRLDKGLVETLENWLQHHPKARLIVIDTVARVRAKSSRERSLYEQDYEVGADLTSLAGKYSVAIILIHHLKKGDADDPMDLVSGSTGLTAGVDGVMVLNRTRSAADAVLKAIHRELKDDPELALGWNPEAGRWTFLGSAEEYRMGKERREIFDVMAREDKAMKPFEVAEQLGKPTDNVRMLMGKMLDEGLLDRPAEYGKYVISKNAERPSPLSVPLVSHAPHSTDSGDSAYKQVEGLADDAEVF